MIIKTFCSCFVLLFCKITFAQYNAECFVVTHEAITKEIANPSIDTVHFKDSVYYHDGTKKYLDTIFYSQVLDIDVLLKKIIGCRMPDFSFFNINREEFSISKIKTNFTILNFSNVLHSSDVDKSILHQLSKLKTELKDSLTVINIFQEPDAAVMEYAKNYESNMEYVANADLLTYTYSFGTESIIFVLDKYKNIVYVKSGSSYEYSYSGTYNDLIKKIRASKCGD